jgi:acyl-CoA thioester hydrolase
MYTKEYKAKNEHIDVQGIMDGLYYPFYMEDCRHTFVREIMKFNIEDEAKNGINMVLAGYTIRFMRPLKKDDNFIVTCELFKDPKSESKFHIRQAIIIDEKTYTEATFTATCILASGGRPFLPELVKEQVQRAPELSA